MATDQLSDQEIQFKKRARRRLIGAIALVLLMITVLPMVLDDRAAKTPQQEIAITIPSQDGGEFTSKIVPVDPNPAPGKQPEANPEPVVPLVQPLGKPQGSQAQIGKNESHTAAVAPTPAANDPNKEMPGKAPAEKPASAGAEKPTAEAGSFSVQIGVFSDAANVKKMQQTLQDQGYKSYTEKLSTPNGEKIRLRAGPFTAKSDAELALSKIKDAGLSGMLVSNK